MDNEFFLDLCFVQDKIMPQAFYDAVNLQLKALFKEKAQWQIETKREDQASILVVEVKGMWEWDNEEQVVDYLEKAASSEFWNWLYGYHIELDIKQHAACSHCG